LSEISDKGELKLPATSCGESPTGKEIFILYSLAVQFKRESLSLPVRTFVVFSIKIMLISLKEYKLPVPITYLINNGRKKL